MAEFFQKEKLKTNKILNEMILEVFNGKK